MSESWSGLKLVSRSMIVGAACVGLWGRVEITEDISNQVETALQCVDFDRAESGQAPECVKGIDPLNNELVTNVFLVLGSGAVMTAGASIATSPRRAGIFQRTY